MDMKTKQFRQLSFLVWTAERVIREAMIEEADPVRIARRMQGRPSRVLAPQRVPAKAMISVSAASAVSLAAIRLRSPGRVLAGFLGAVLAWDLRSRRAIRNSGSVISDPMMCARVLEGEPLSVTR